MKTSEIGKIVLETGRDEICAPKTVRFALVKESDRAIQVADGTFRAWLPRSQITIIVAGKSKSGHTIIDVTMPGWLAAEKMI